MTHFEKFTLSFLKLSIKILLILPNSNPPLFLLSLFFNLWCFSTLFVWFEDDFIHHQSWLPSRWLCPFKLPLFLFPVLLRNWVPACLTWGKSLSFSLFNFCVSFEFRLVSIVPVLNWILTVSISVLHEPSFFLNINAW